MSRRSLAAAFASFLLASCAGTAMTNKPLPPESLNDTSGPISKDGYHVRAVEDGTASDTLVLLAFSGGGKRSAAFGYGVLRGLRDFPIMIHGHERPMLDEIDMMASVSGGSFPAAYYGLYRDKIFTDFQKDFLDEDIESYVWGTYLIPWHLGWLVDPDYGTNDRMAEVYDELMFHGATYADLLRAGRPVLSIDATDVDHGLAFQFTQDQFDLICSDLSSYPIARAVAASNGFPIVFTPITLKSYRPQCGGREPTWLRADPGPDQSSRAAQQAQNARVYLDENGTHYVHLMDGGISDNLAMRGIITTILMLTGVTSPELDVDLRHFRRIVLISADGQSANDASTAREKHLSSVGQIVSAVSGTQIDSYNFETMVLARSMLDNVRDRLRKERCAEGPSAPDGTPCGDVESYFVHLSLAGIADPDKRARLERVPTGLTIDAADTALLVTAGEEQVKSSPELASFRDSLR